eukprot:CAMPEP_0198215422 /NCGR_PEP_ID=MMETSP1445-20131203/49752_1 /TAXON_ID=36898 /ORGANISM="Pyramimonas sp., Strain CCMP2087" /LENGTH=45 /DNA_ID= /DNA_START= /DNA_END= /DNA_ORIENTATION=
MSYPWLYGSSTRAIAQVHVGVHAMRYITSTAAPTAPPAPPAACVA